MSPARLSWKSHLFLYSRLQMNIIRPVSMGNSIPFPSQISSSIVEPRWNVVSNSFALQMHRSLMTRHQRRDWAHYHFVLQSTIDKCDFGRWYTADESACCLVEIDSVGHLLLLPFHGDGSKVLYDLLTVRYMYRGTVAFIQTNIRLTTLAQPKLGLSSDAPHSLGSTVTQQ